MGERLSWCSLFSFIKHLPPSSAYFREEHPEEAAWLNGWKNASILADLWDLTVAIHSQRGKEPQKYPRPGAKEDNKRHYGADPIPISEFNDWWNGCADPRPRHHS